MMDIPAELAYSRDHEWVRAGSGGCTVGITDFAQDALGDVVFVDLPTLGAVVTAHEPMCEIESTKSVSDVFAPVSGVVADVNVALEDEPHLVNESPYGDGWLCVIAPSDASDVGELLDAAEYAQLIAEDL